MRGLSAVPSILKLLGRDGPTPPSTICEILYKEAKISEQTVYSALSELLANEKIKKDIDRDHGKCYVYDLALPNFNHKQGISVQESSSFFKDSRKYDFEQSDLEQGYRLGLEWSRFDDHSFHYQINREISMYYANFEALGNLANIEQPLMEDSSFLVDAGLLKQSEYSTVNESGEFDTITIARGVYQDIPTILQREFPCVQIKRMVRLKEMADIFASQAPP